MKLKDIFNIDLSTRGGAKLYRKIMGKYNIPKQDSKQLVKEIRNSSEGGGDTLYYYKWKDGADKFNELLVAIGNILIIKNIINVGCLLYKMIGYYTGEELSNMELIRDSDAFCIFGEETTIFGFGNNPVTIPKGNLIDKVNALRVIYPSEDASQIIPLVIDYVNNNLTEITKEEYESMITYKPE